MRFCRYKHIALFSPNNSEKGSMNNKLPCFFPLNSLFLERSLFTELLTILFNCFHYSLLPSIALSIVIIKPPPRTNHLCEGKDVHKLCLCSFNDLISNSKVSRVWRKCLKLVASEIYPDHFLAILVKMNLTSLKFSCFLCVLGI